MRPAKLSSVYLSLFFAFMLVLFPWSGVALALRPDWMLLVIIFWLLRAPNLCSVGTAWVVGLLMDLATGGIFGQYALAYTITIFFAVMYQHRLVLFNNVQQLVYVFTLLLMSQLIVLILKTFAGREWLGWSYFLPSIVGITIWQAAILLGVNTGRHTRGS